ncbi:MAG: TIGR01212 family radical SAM protein, partial [Oscillospiraceae bacterium]|nr:TIGR01212 family radical SAM protein [Oscillospiraceae bacterium]
MQKGADRQQNITAERYRSLNGYLRECFGGKLYKLALDGGMTCPNRDGTLGSRGCIFCSAGGSGEFAEKPCGSIAEQIDAAKQRVSAKTKGIVGYIAYFQSYTNTYAPVSRLRELFTAAVAHPDVTVLSIATRPDCLGDDVVELLAELNCVKPVWVELGLQTSREDTAQYIRRGYPNEVYADAVKRLTAAGIGVITHIIIGLPDETKEDVLRTAKYAYRCGSRGVKLQLLHILKGCDLAQEYEKGKVRVMEMEEYFDTLHFVLERIPGDVVIHRLTGDGPKKLL